jgi:hypothetical protein
MEQNVLAFLLAVAIETAQTDRAVSAAIERWKGSVEAVRARPISSSASARERIHRLIELDEVTRQNLWIMDDPALTASQQREVGSTIGPLLNQVDEFTAAELKKILPESGWFDNRTDGRQVTHGAWLIAQHSPDPDLLTFALAAMAKLVKVGGVDARDYALTYDRVQVYQGKAQRFGSQARCLDGHLALQPILDEANVDTLREEIGWSQTLSETKGDLSIGKPCVQ